MTLYLDTCHRQISIWTRSTVNLDTFGHIKRQTHLGCWRVASWKGISCSTNQNTLDCKIQPSDWLNRMSLSQPTINRVFLLIWSISIPSGVNIPFPLGSERYCRKGGKWTILMMEQHTRHIGANASFFYLLFYFSREQSCRPWCLIAWLRFLFYRDYCTLTPIRWLPFAYSTSHFNTKIWLTDARTWL